MPDPALEHDQARPRFRCQAKQVRRRQGERCTAWARYRIITEAFGGETMVCGTHARGWLPRARVALGVSPDEVREA